MEEIFSRETSWVSNINPERIVEVKIKDMNNRHLVNTINHLEHEIQIRSRRDELIKIMRGEIERRGLSQEFVNGAPYPFDQNAEYEYYKEPPVVVRRETSHMDRLSAVLGD